MSFLTGDTTSSPTVGLGSILADVSKFIRETGLETRIRKLPATTELEGVPDFRPAPGQPPAATGINPQQVGTILLVLGVGTLVVVLVLMLAKKG